MQDKFIAEIAAYVLREEPSDVCRICGRSLSDPDSIRRGIGPECYQKQKKKVIEEIQISFIQNQKEGQK